MLLSAFLFASLPAIAGAAEWREGTVTTPFGLSDSGGLLVTTDANRDPSLTVPYEAATTFDGKSLEFEPRSIRVAKDGSFLVACGKHGYVLRIYPNGTTHTFWAADRPPGEQRPFDAFPLEDGGMLVVDRGTEAGNGRVIRVDASDRIVWQFGGTSGLGAGQVWDPFTAEPLKGGHTLIADSLGYRVIEVDDASGEIVWSYGTYKVPGSGPGLLVRPHSAQRLTNGNTLICDAESHRVIEVNAGKQIVWSYGTGIRGSGAGQLANPNSAVRLPNGNTLISDSDNARVLEVGPSGAVVQGYGVSGRIPQGGAIDNPRAALRLVDGSTIIADLGNMRLASYGYAPHKDHVATSALIDPSVGKFKAFTKIVVSGSSPVGTAIRAEYTTDNRTWKSVPPGGVLPATATGTAIRYRLHLVTGDGSVAPSVGQVAITWGVTTPVTAPKTGTTGSTKTTGKPTVSSGSSTGSGSTGSGSGGSGAQPTASAAPGAGTAVASGMTGSTGDLASGATAQTTMSGWVMSETKDDVSWAGAASSARGPGATGELRATAVPAATLLLTAYILGVAWSPGSRALSRLVTAVLPH